MKVSREQETFKPVTITLESYEEVKLIKELLGMTTPNIAEKILGEKFDPFHMYDELHEMTPELDGCSSGFWMEIN